MLVQVNLQYALKDIIARRAPVKFRFVMQDIIVHKTLHYHYYALKVITAYLGKNNVLYVHKDITAMLV